MNPVELPLRDVHLPPEPSWWPPAPGWWGVAIIVLLCALMVLIRVVRAHHRRRRWRRGFDAACNDEATPQNVAMMSELLRRAARHVDAGADRLEGEEWLRFLDGSGHREFSQGPGRLLLEGGYRQNVEPRQFEQLRALARTRFLELMAGRR